MTVYPSSERCFQRDSMPCYKAIKSIIIKCYSVNMEQNLSGIHETALKVKWVQSAISKVYLMT